MTEPIHYCYEDLYVAVVNNQYEFRPCGNCEGGKIYVDGEIGEVITARRYQELEQQEDSMTYIDVCEHCFGTGKLIKLNWDS